MTGEEVKQRPAHDEASAYKAPLWRRLGWLAIIWLGSVFALFIFASLLRMFRTAAGMKSH